MFSLGILVSFPLEILGALFFRARDFSQRRSDDRFRAGHVRSIRVRCLVAGHSCLSTDESVRQQSLIKSIHWNHTAEGRRRGRRNGLDQQPQTSFAEFFDATSDFPRRRTPATRSTSSTSPRSVPSSARYFTTSRTRFRRRRVARSTGFRESRVRVSGDCPRKYSQSSIHRRTVCQVRLRWGALRTDLSAGRHATAAFPSRFGGSPESTRRGRDAKHSQGRHAIRSIPRPLRYSVARNAAILLHIHLAPPHRWLFSAGERSSPLRSPLPPRRVQTKRRGTLIFGGFN